MRDLLFSRAFNEHVTAAPAVVVKELLKSVQSQLHVLTPIRGRESIILTVHRPRSPTAQSDVHRPFWAATQRHRRTSTGTDHIRCLPGREVVSLAHSPIPATDVPTLVLTLDILQPFDFMVHTFTRIIRACVPT